MSSLLKTRRTVPEPVSSRSRRSAGGRSGNPSGALHPVRIFLRRALALLLLISLAWSIWVVRQINAVAAQDRAQPADAIAVFGAAEYSGRPSPVYHARLDHAVSLYRRQMAPRVITLGGGSDRDSGKTEGGVGRDYLLANGVPLAAIIAETHSTDTREQTQRLADIAHEHKLEHIVVVSDATHLFRIQQLCEEAGLDVYTSPRQAYGRIDSYDLAMRYAHEIVSYTVLRLGLNDTPLRSWIEGRADD